ncbi:progonadoliberin-2 [Nyctibius grandis]|uniref:progonadoliberin-2 n=1 Tax=Nyctibius grandis TaxID=48427 RepID=UPI0035BBA9B8
MAPRGSLLLLLLLLACALPCCPGQHWSHGWYPGGKRHLGPPQGTQVSAPLRRCRPPPCPPRREEPLLGAALHRG